jgi:uncharacterized protein with HEPN domain
VKDDSVYLRHILEAVRRIEQNTAEGKDVFFASHTLQDATLRNLQTMAEATQRLSPECRAHAPHVDWRALAGFRNILVHNYLGIDLEQIWKAIQQDVPGLKTAVTTLLVSTES